MTNSFNNPAAQQNSETIGTVYSAAIQPKANDVQGVVPLPSELIDGEIAVNTADGKLFVKNTDGTIKEISGAGGGGSAKLTYDITTNSTEPVPPPNDFYYFVVDSYLNIDASSSIMTTFSASFNGSMNEIDELGRDLKDNPLWMPTPETGNPKCTVWISVDSGKVWQQKLITDLGELLDTGGNAIPDTVSFGLDVNSPDFPEEWTGIGLQDYGNQVILTLLDPDTTGDPPIPSYLLAGPGLPSSGFVGNKNPDLYVIRGQEYEFSNLMNAHPFQIQLEPGLGKVAYSNGIVGSPALSGLLEWAVALDAPATLYYQSTTDATMGGVINVLEEPNYSTIEVYDDVANAQDFTYIWRFNVVAESDLVLKDGSQASCRASGFDPSFNNFRGTFSDSDADGKAFIYSPIFADLFDPIDPVAGPPYYQFWFSIDKGVTWIYHSPMSGFGRQDPAEGYRFQNPTYQIEPVWDGVDEVMVYVGNADPGPGKRSPSAKELLIYDASISAYKPGQTSVSQLSDFDLVDGPRISYTYNNVVLAGGNTQDGQMKINAYNGGTYYVRFDYSYYGACCSNNVVGIIDAANAWQAATGSYANQPFWLKDEFTGKTTAHFGTYSNVGSGTLQFDAVTGDPLPTEFKLPGKFTISALDPNSKIAPTQGDRIGYNATTQSWEPQAPTTVNGQTGIVSLDSLQLADVQPVPFTDFYYFTSTDAATNIQGGTLALITTAITYSSPDYLIMDTTDSLGRDITQNAGWQAITVDGGIVQDLWVSVDGGITWNYNRYSSYGSNPGAANPSGTAFYGLSDPQPPGATGVCPPIQTAGIDTIVALQDPTLGAIPESGQALVASQLSFDSYIFTPTEIITMGQIKTASALATDFADFQARIAAL